jgi:hypothetical protein
MDKEITICRHCKFRSEYDGVCLSLGAPMTDFVEGEKRMSSINVLGMCEWYEGGVWDSDSVSCTG